jgi:hypothetical protein
MPLNARRRGGVPNRVKKFWPRPTALEGRGLPQDGTGREGRAASSIRCAALLLSDASGGPLGLQRAIRAVGPLPRFSGSVLRGRPRGAALPERHVRVPPSPEARRPGRGAGARTGRAAPWRGADETALDPQCAASSGGASSRARRRCARPAVRRVLRSCDAEADTRSRIGLDPARPSGAAAVAVIRFSERAK